MKLLVEAWERARAEAFADALEQASAEGVTGAEELARSLPEGVSFSALAKAETRRLAYAIFRSLGWVEDWYVIPAERFANNWVSLGNDFSHAPAVMIDPFGFVHWRGLAGRASGTAVNGETICTFPARYNNAKLSGYPCITNSGLIHVGVFNDAAGGEGRLAWRTTGGFTGGFGFVYLDNIQPYDTRG